MPVTRPIVIVLISGVRAGVFMTAITDITIAVVVDMTVFTLFTVRDRNQLMTETNNGAKRHHAIVLTVTGDPLLLIANR
jgi:hypothetical protein